MTGWIWMPICNAAPRSNSTRARDITCRSGPSASTGAAKSAIVPPPQLPDRRYETACRDHHLLEHHEARPRRAKIGALLFDVLAFRGGVGIAEAETIRRRPKARCYHRRMSRRTGAYDAEYGRVLGELLAMSGPDLGRLRRKIERQDAAIEALRREYGVNEERPSSFGGR